MKVTENDITIVRITLDHWDTAVDLYETVGEYAASGSVSIVDGAIEIREAF